MDAADVPIVPIFIVGHVSKLYLAAGPSGGACAECRRPSRTVG